jgi:DNA-binding transcriptional ArsR family regulator
MVPRTCNTTGWPMHSIAEIFAAMGNTRRLQALMYLEKGEATVNQMADAIGLTQSCLSQHLAVLRRSNLVRTRRNAQTIYYALDSEPMARILGLLSEMYEGDPRVMDEEENYPEHYL